MTRRDTSGDAMAAALTKPVGPPVALSGRHADSIREAMIAAADFLRRHQNQQPTKVFRKYHECSDVRARLESAIALLDHAREQNSIAAEGSGDGNGVGIQREKPTSNSAA